MCPEANLLIRNIETTKTVLVQQRGSIRMAPAAECTVDREAYAEMYGPTTGDMVRLADTDLWIKVEKDYTTCKSFQLRKRTC